MLVTVQMYLPLSLISTLGMSSVLVSVPIALGFMSLLRGLDLSQLYVCRPSPNADTNNVMFSPTVASTLLDTVMRYIGAVDVIKMCKLHLSTRVC